MRRYLIGIAIIVVLCTVFLVYNHKQLPTKNNVFNITNNWSPATEGVYLVREIDGEWLTIFRNMHSIMLGRLWQNWLGFWELKDDYESGSTLVSTYTPPAQNDEFTWSASLGGEGKPSYYFGQIINPTITKIEVETKKDIYEDALIINAEGTRFFYLKLDGDPVMPVHIKGFTDDGELIHDTVKPVKKS